MCRVIATVIARKSRRPKVLPSAEPFVAKSPFRFPIVRKYRFLIHRAPLAGCLRFAHLLAFGLQQINGQIQPVAAGGELDALQTA